MNRLVIVLFVVLLLTIGALNAISCQNDDTVPEWEIGDTWTYNIDTITLKTEDNGFSLDGNLIIKDLTLEVVQELSNSYVVNFNANVNGEFDIYIDIISFSLSGRLVDSLFTQPEFKGTMMFRKTDLAIEQISIESNFILQLRLFNILPVRVPADIELKIDFDIPLKSVEFPMFVGKEWGNAPNTVTIDGTIKSKWLNRIYVLNRFLGFLPSDIEALLPIIDISDLIEVAGAENNFEIPGVASFCCINKETITLDAGTYDAYKIEIDMDKGYFYYAPGCGMVVKVEDLDLQEYVPFLGILNFELVETNFQ